jgi:hypothetical protein
MAYDPDTQIWAVTSEGKQLGARRSEIILVSLVNTNSRSSLVRPSLSAHG